MLISELMKQTTTTAPHQSYFIAVSNSNGGGYSCIAKLFLPSGLLTIVGDVGAVLAEAEKHIDICHGFVNIKGVVNPGLFGIDRDICSLRYIRRKDFYSLKTSPVIQNIINQVPNLAKRNLFVLSDNAGTVKRVFRKLPSYYIDIKKLLK